MLCNELFSYQFSFLTMTILCTGLCAQEIKFPGIDVSPADITLRTGDGVIAKVVYGRPQMKGRIVFGGIVPYDKVWRTGANEATEITFFQDVILGDVKVSAGTYTLFTIPGQESWELLLNSDLNQWGAYRADMDHTVARTSGSSHPLRMRSRHLPSPTAKERKAITSSWQEKTMVEFPIKLQ